MMAKDIAATTAGATAAVWNFVAEGYLNTILAAVAGVLTIAVLVQRYRINRRKLEGAGDLDHDAVDPPPPSSQGPAQGTE